MFLVKFLCVVGIATVSAQFSWQVFVDEQLVGAGLEKATIFGLYGSTWAETNIQPTFDEKDKIVAQFSSPGSVFANGVKLGGTKYFGIKSDPSSIYGKKGAGGIVCVKTNKAVIAGIYNENLQPGEATIIVEKAADYLRENGL